MRSERSAEEVSMELQEHWTVRWPENPDCSSLKRMKIIAFKTINNDKDKDMAITMASGHLRQMSWLTCKMMTSAQTLDSIRSKE